MKKREPERDDGEIHCLVGWGGQNMCGICGKPIGFRGMPRGDYVHLGCAHPARAPPSAQPASEPSSAPAPPGAEALREISRSSPSEE